MDVSTEDMAALLMMSGICRRVLRVFHKTPMGGQSFLSACGDPELQGEAVSIVKGACGALREVGAIVIAAPLCYRVSDAALQLCWADGTRIVDGDPEGYEDA